MIFFLYAVDLSPFSGLSFSGASLHLYYGLGILSSSDISLSLGLFGKTASLSPLWGGEWGSPPYVVALYAFTTFSPPKTRNVPYNSTFPRFSCCNVLQYMRLQRFPVFRLFATRYAFFTCCCGKQTRVTPYIATRYNVAQVFPPFPCNGESCS